MTVRNALWVEKLQVQVAAIAAVLLTYLLVWRVVSPTDPEAPITFLASGLPGNLAVLAVVLWSVAIASGVLTFCGRPEGALVALVVGAGGLSLRSHSIRTLLFDRQEDMGAMYWQMALEVVVLAALIAVGAVVAGLARQMARAAMPKLAWRDPLPDLSEADRKAYNAAIDEARTQKWSLALGMSVFTVFLGLVFVPGGANARLPGKDSAPRRGLNFLVTLAISLAAVLVLMQSARRGQVLFALLAGNFLGVWLTQQALPTRLTAIAWVVPILIALGLYVLAAATAVSGAGAWMDVPFYAQALPIDWATVGLGGAILGQWVTLRMREMKYIEQQEQEAQENEGA